MAALSVLWVMMGGPMSPTNPLTNTSNGNVISKRLAEFDLAPCPRVTWIQISLARLWGVLDQEARSPSLISRVLAALTTTTSNTYQGWAIPSLRKKPTWLKPRLWKVKLIFILDLICKSGQALVVGCTESECGDSARNMDAMLGKKRQDTKLFSTFIFFQGRDISILTRKLI